MAETATKDIPTYETGGTVRIEFNARDENGVARAEIRFRNEGKRLVAGLRREIELGGETEVTASFSFDVDEELPPGHYVCDYIALTDNLGNTSLFATPGIEFRVEGDETGYEGPALLNWNFA